MLGQSCEKVCNHPDTLRIFFMYPVGWEFGTPFQVLSGEAIITLDNSSNNPEAGVNVLEVVPMQPWKPSGFKRPETVQRVKLQIKQVSLQAGISEQLQSRPLNINAQLLFPTNLCNISVDEARQLRVRYRRLIGGDSIPFVEISILHNKSRKFVFHLLHSSSLISMILRPRRTRARLCFQASSTKTRIRDRFRIPELSGLIGAGQAGRRHNTR